MLVLAINLVGDGLRDAFDPNTQGRIVTTPGAEPLLSVRNLSVTFRSEAGLVTAVRSLSYEVRPGELLGIVGESGRQVGVVACHHGPAPGSAQVTGSARLNGRS